MAGSVKAERGLLLFATSANVAFKAAAGAWVLLDTSRKTLLEAVNSAFIGSIGFHRVSF